MHRSPSLSVLLGLDSRDPYHRDMIEGVLDFNRAHTGCELLVMPDGKSVRAHLKQSSGVQGIIMVDTWLSHAELVSLGLPTVLVLCARKPARLSGISDDEVAIAEMALGHFRELGVTRMAFLDHLNPPSDRRLAFAATVSKAGLECHAYPPVGYQVEPDWHARTERIADWVEPLPKPIGIFCFHVDEAQQLAMACSRRKVRVPEDVAILSCGGDDIECHLATPPISAIDQGGDRLGHEAARRLAELMAGINPEPTFTRFAPVGITRRQSTDLLAVDDPHVAQAITLIHEQACEGLTVSEVIARVPISRRRLDYAFERVVGRTMHEQITHERLARAKRLLIRTNLPLTDVAARAGFAYPTRLSEAFRKALGITPTEYRRQNQSTAVGA